MVNKPKIIKLQGGEVYFFSWFQRSQSMPVLGPDALEPVARQYVMAPMCGRGKLLTSWRPGSEKGKSKSQYPLQPHATVALLLL
jgi:hypothetical protein